MTRQLNNNNDPLIIKLAVDEKYSEEATLPQTSSCCCASEDSDIPFDARSVSLGCGSPMKYVTFLDGMTLVSIGCGGGIDVFAAANKLDQRKGKIIGIDSTLKMIARARSTAKKYGYTNVEFRLGELENLPLESSIADIVTSNCVINLVPDKTRAFQEIFRVLKQGGSITILRHCVEKSAAREGQERSAKVVQLHFWCPFHWRNGRCGKKSRLC